MATSGSTDFSVSRDDIITEALEHCGVLAMGQTPNAAQLTSCSRTLNMMIKHWMADGLQLWKIQRATILLEKGKTEYDLSATGDLATQSYVETALSAASAASDTTLTVDSITGISASDVIAIQLDDGTLHKDAVNGAPSGSTVTITTGLSSAAAIDRPVYAFTTKINRPNRIINAFTRDSSGNDVDVDLISREEYWRLGDKDASGTPTQLYHDPQLAVNTVRIFPAPDDVTVSMEITYETPIEDFDNASDTPDFPQEWYEPLATNLALRLTTKFGTPAETTQKIALLAEKSYMMAIEFDNEDTSIMLVPDSR